MNWRWSRVDPETAATVVAEGKIIQETVGDPWERRLLSDRLRDGEVCMIARGDGAIGIGSYEETQQVIDEGG